MAETLDDLLDNLAHRQETGQFVKQVDWDAVRERLVNDDEATRLLLAMDEAGGEPALVQNEGALRFFDTAPEASKIPHRKSLCYDEEARLNCKKNPPTGDVVTAAEKLGAYLLDEEDYLLLQSIGDFDLKCSCLLATPAGVRKLGGAVFGDKRFGRAFIYHNTADCYYASRGYRLKVEIN
ncbi:DUF4256 domain-containing protein [Limosilactobacillus fermentum]|uniref:DUF4256 domain-containing protein n=1 Tax=Limosilactobacillus fermentum TaxID=1613 RepID=UPI0021E8B650|nr:DUF4256 domain-containing protein [Limosilactobacillus fermentum]MCV3755766.1 DUF4256 domain-containing protein [Limosilactobacillus fermentum]